MDDKVSRLKVEHLNLYYSIIDLLRTITHCLMDLIYFFYFIVFARDANNAAISCKDNERIKDIFIGTIGFHSAILISMQ